MEEIHNTNEENNDDFNQTNFEMDGNLDNNLDIIQNFLLEEAAYNYSYNRNNLETQV